MAFISGASRGIGLSLVKRILATSESMPVIAAGRTVADSSALHDLRGALACQRPSLPLSSASRIASRACFQCFAAATLPFSITSSIVTRSNPSDHFPGCHQSGTATG